MNWKKVLGLLAAGIMIFSNFLNWVTLPARHIIVNGISAEGTSFGKPGYFHLLLSAFFLVLHMVPRIWAKRANLIIAALNLAWAIRNYFLITACRGGECPEKQTGLYLIMLGALLMMIASLFPDIDLSKANRKKNA